MLEENLGVYKSIDHVIFELVEGIRIRVRPRPRRYLGQILPQFVCRFDLGAQGRLENQACF